MCGNACPSLTIDSVVQPWPPPCTVQVAGRGGWVRGEIPSDQPLDPPLPCLPQSQLDIWPRGLVVCVLLASSGLPRSILYVTVRRRLWPCRWKRPILKWGVLSVWSSFSTTSKNIWGIIRHVAYLVQDTCCLLIGPSAAPSNILKVNWWCLIYPAETTDIFFYRNIRWRGTWWDMPV